MSIRILHVVGDSKFGGASHGILRLARQWQSVGWQVAVLATDPLFCSEARKQGVPIAELDVIWREIRPLRDLGGLLRLYRYLRRERFTIVHTHTTKAGFVGRLAAWLAGIPVVIHTAHGFAFHERSPWWKIAGYAVLERIASWGCRRVVTVSGFHARWGARLGVADASKFRIIRNGVPDVPVPPEEEIAQLRRELALEGGDLTLITPGRLVPEKGLEEILLGLRLLADRGVRNIRWLVVGAGSLQDALEKSVAELGLGDQVRFLGFRSDVSKLLAAADVVALPSWREGLSIALLEAMACAKPVIASSIGSNVEATDGGEAAELVEPGDIEGLAEAIRLLACDPARRAALAARARKKYETSFRQERMLAEYHQLYLELLEEGRRAEPVSTLLSS